MSTDATSAATAASSGPAASGAAATDGAAADRKADRDPEDGAALQAMQKEAEKAAQVEVPIPPKHTFRVVIRGLTLRNVLPWDGSSSTVYVEFTIGKKKELTPKEQEERAGEPEEPPLYKPVSPKTVSFSKKTVMANQSVSWPDEMVDTTMNFCYEELAETELRLDLYHKPGFFSFRKFMGTSRIVLLDLANGSIQQEHKMILLQRDGQRVNQTSAICTFMCYFQELTRFELKFAQWQAYDLRPVKQTATGLVDPFLNFAIRPDWRKFFRKGGFFFRKTSSDVQTKNNNPFWIDAGTLSYYGTRSELEDEDLVVHVIDHFAAGTNDQIAMAAIPLRGVLDYGFVEAELAYLETPTSTPYPAGRIEGYVVADNVPPHCQFGDTVAVKPGREYLVVRVEAAARLKAFAAGYCSAFVEVTWNGIKQETKVVVNDLNPHFDDVLYFPLRMVKVTPDLLAARGPISFQVFHKSESGNSFLGAAELPLHYVTQPRPRGGRGFDGDLKLHFSGVLTNQAVRVSVGFSPDIKGTIRAPESGPPPRQLPAEIAERGQKWQQGLPASSVRTFQYFALDESGVEHFLPDFLCKMHPPLKFDNPLEIFRMIRCITWVSDSEALDAEDVWATPNFLMDLRRGDSEDHAILFANLLLGLGMDAYLCVGRNLHNQEHTWVMTREKDGGVVFWETLTGKRFRLPNRWSAPVTESFNVDYLTPEEAARRKAEEERAKAEAAARSLALRDITIDLAVEASAGIEMVERTDNTLLFYEQDAVFGDECSARLRFENSFAERLRASGATPDMIKSIASAEGSERRTGTVRDPTDAVPPLPYKCIDVVLNTTNLWGNRLNADPARVVFDLDDASRWSPFISPADGFTYTIRPFYSPRRLAPPQPEGRCAMLATQVYRDLVGGVINSRHRDGLDTSFEPRLRPVISKGLEIMERQYLTDDSLRPELDQWMSELQAACMPGYTFTGRPMHFCYADARQIRKWITDNTDLHKESDPKVRFAAGTYVKSYWNQTLSVWVMLCKLTPL